MQAIGITPRQPHTACLVELPMPQLDEVPDGRGVLVKVLQVGLDGTDKELYLGEYGAAPDRYDFLVIGHESFGQVIKVGLNVAGLAPGDYGLCRNSGALPRYAAPVVRSTTGSAPTT